MTQSEKILNHMKCFGTITSLEALSEYGIMRLASRISDLKKEGYDIERRFVRSKNRFGEPVAYAEYSLIKEEDHERLQ